ncbi:XRE family transcriptional regulator [Micromonospora zhanjiangensis]|uniref:XRE family transcriptional regulator n=1 Tax=Micromonospora zhanjiangensis TaxID=1522057 RepID=A0ABV8KIC4_9ACTN
MRSHSTEPLAGDASLLWSWKRWEAGEVEPDDFYKKLIARTFGTVTDAFFPRPARRDADAELIAGSGMDTLEIMSRLRASDVSAATLDALRITADRLCCEYPYAPAAQLQMEGRAWLHRITRLLDGRMTLAQHREVLSLAGLVALLLGCVEYDMGRRRDAEVTRRAALALGEEAGNADIMGWAQEMRAWFALTQGNYEGVVTAARAGCEVAGSRSVAVQLAAQEAKAWARMGDRRKVEVALDRGRSLLDVLPPPDDLDHHFIVDPAKFDCYAMDCYRALGEDRLARMYSTEVISTSTRFDGTYGKPMRVAEAKVTLGVVAARNGDVDQAVAHGRDALGGDRQSLPSLLLCSRELSGVLRYNFKDAPVVSEYFDEVETLARR